MWPTCENANFRIFILIMIKFWNNHRHLIKYTAQWRVLAALLASLVLLMAAAKKEEKKAFKTVLVAGT